ncbi:MAG: CAP domain-containing protein [Chlorobi bacterium]|nr:CAP domain-containing protein [Chlorobiota bacterium]
MKSRNTLVILVFAVLINNALVSQTGYAGIPDVLLKEADTAKDADYLSRNEKDVILYMNLARLNGKWFIANVLEKNKDIIKPGYEKYIRSLMTDLKKVKDLQPLYPSADLTDAARYHAKDMGVTGKVGHKSSDGTKTFDRIKRYARGNYKGENCQYGYSDPVLIVVSLLVDGGVHSLGHRRNILNPEFKYAGVAIESHKKYKYNCVMDFSDSK